MPLQLISHSFASEAMQSFIKGWPQLDWLDEEDIGKGEANHRFSLFNKQQGLYLFFTDLESYWQRYGAPKEPGGLVLSRLTFVLDFHEDFTPYSGLLPCNLAADATFDDAVRAAGTPQKSWSLTDNKIVKARWIVSQQQIDISFSAQTGQMRLVAVSPTYLPEFQNRQAASLPSPSDLTSLFGKPLKELALLESMVPFELDQRGGEIQTYGEANFSKEYGLELYFKPAQDFPEEYGINVEGTQLCLSGARYRCDLDFSSSGYLGVLPWGLSFDDPQQQVQQRSSGVPVQQNFDRDDGSQRWLVDGYDVHILYSFLEDKIYRVTLLAHGCYND